MKSAQPRFELENSYYVFFVMVIMESMRAFNVLGTVGVLAIMASDLLISVTSAHEALVQPYMLGLVLGQCFLGLLSDRYGRMVVFLLF